MKITFEEKGIKTTFYSFKEFKKYIKECREYLEIIYKD
jgi:hypothetical protein